MGTARLRASGGGLDPIWGGGVVTDMYTCVHLSLHSLFVHFPVCTLYLIKENFGLSERDVHISEMEVGVVIMRESKGSLW